jgi:hypothetical protein
MPTWKYPTSTARTLGSQTSSGVSRNTLLEHISRVDGGRTVSPHDLIGEASSEDSEESDDFSESDGFKEPECHFECHIDNVAHINPQYY